MRHDFSLGKALSSPAEMTLVVISFAPVCALASVGACGMLSARANQRARSRQDEGCLPARSTRAEPSLTR